MKKLAALIIAAALMAGCTGQQIDDQDYNDRLRHDEQTIKMKKVESELETAAFDKKIKSCQPLVKEAQVECIKMVRQQQGGSNKSVVVNQ